MSALIEDGKEYFVELLSRLNEKTWSFREPVADEKSIKTEKAPNFYKLIRCVSTHLGNEMLLQLATKIIRSTNSREVKFSSVFLHQHLLPEWKVLIDKFLRQVQVVKWELNNLTKVVELKIRICSSPPQYLLIHYNVNSDSDDEDDETLDFELVELSKDEKASNIDTKENLSNNLSFENLLCIKNQNLGLSNLPLNIWLSSIFQMITTLLSKKQAETVNYCPIHFGGFPYFKYFPTSSQHSPLSAQSATNGECVRFELPAPENQCWIPKKNIHAPCYARFIDNNNDESKTKEENDLLRSDVGQWIGIPERLSGLLIYECGKMKSKKERERVVMETCAFVRNNLLRQFIDSTIGPISPKLQQDAHAFLKTLNFVSNLTKIQKSATAQGSEIWWINNSGGVNSGDDANDRIAGKINRGCNYWKEWTVIDIIRRTSACVRKDDEVGRPTRMKKTIYHDKTCVRKVKKVKKSQYIKSSKDAKNSIQTKLLCSKLDSSESFPNAFACPLLSDDKYCTTIREFLSWIFILDEQISADSDFREIMFGASKSIEVLNLADLEKLKPVKRLSIVKSISINNKLKKLLFAGLNSPTKTNKSSLSKSNQSNRLHSDLCNLVLGYAIIFADPIRQELELELELEDDDD